MFALAFAFFLSVGVVVRGVGRVGAVVEQLGGVRGRGAADERVRALAQPQQLVLDALRDRLAGLLLARVSAAEPATDG